MYLGNLVVTAQHSKAGMLRWILSRIFSVVGVILLLHLIMMTTFADEDASYQSSAHTRKQRSYEGYRSTKVRTAGDENALDTDDNKSGAIFGIDNSTVVLAQVGSTATLHCIVRNIGDGMVSWIRRKDYHLLTVGIATYSSDERFQASHPRHSQDWALQIRYAQTRDAGLYECQVSSHPPSSLFMELRVVEARAEIVGAPDKYIKGGSTLKLTCLLQQSTEPPVYMFWYHNDRMINYDKTRGVTVKSDRYSSVLTIGDIQKADSGNYSCVPSNARPASINVHILNGEKPAAMQHGSRGSASSMIPSILFHALCTFVTLYYTDFLLSLSRNNCVLSHNRVGVNSYGAIPR